MTDGDHLSSLVVGNSYSRGGDDYAPPHLATWKLGLCSQRLPVFWTISVQPAPFTYREAPLRLRPYLTVLVCA